MGKSNTRTFYRIETLDMDEGGAPKSGYMGPLSAILCLMLGIEPTYTEEELQYALSTTTDINVKMFWAYMMCLIDIPIPEIYEQNKGNSDYFCLYSKEEYEEAAEILKELQYFMHKYLPQYVFKYKKFKLKDDEILYEDMYQIVISKSIYDKHKHDFAYQEL